MALAEPAAGPFEVAVEALERAERVLVFTGAGMSAGPGIPTFTGKESGGLWSAVRAMVLFGLPLAWLIWPEAAWREYVKRLLAPINNAAPGKGHKALREMERLKLRGSEGDVKGPEENKFIVVTTNVDGLHQRAGNSCVYELHGSTAKHKCSKCWRIVDDNTEELIANQVGQGAEPSAAIFRCTDCNALLRPDCVLLMEALPEEAWLKSLMAAKSLKGDDVCLVIGTSASTYPAGYLPEIAKAAGAKVIEINTCKTRITSALGSVFLCGKAEELLDALAARLVPKEPAALAHSQ